MKRLILWSLILLIASLNLTGQHQASSLDEFFQRVANEQASYVQFDTNAAVLFLEDEYPIRYYFETQQHDDQWFFLTYYEQFDHGTQVLCQCELDTLQLIFRGIEEQFAAGHFSSSLYSSNEAIPEQFYAQHCLIAQQLTAFLDQTPVIKALLNGDHQPPQQSGETLQAEIASQMLLRNDGEWLLDVEGHLPEHLLLIEVQKPQLFHLQSPTQSYYPASGVPLWKRQLITSGYHNRQLVGYPRAVWKDDLGNHRVLPTPDPAHSWNVQFMLSADDTAPTGTVAAAGNIHLLVSDGSTEILSDTFSFFKPDTRYKLELEESGNLYMSKAQKDGAFQGGLAYYANDHWRQVLIYQEGGDTVARFAYDEAPRTVEFTPSSDHVYGVKVKRLARKNVIIPFEQKVNTRALQSRFEQGAVHSQRYHFSIRRSGPQYISALYDVFAPYYSGQDSFTLVAAYDNTGRNLLNAQADSIDAYNQWLAAQGDELPWWQMQVEDHWKKGFSWEQHADGHPRPHYHLEVDLYEEAAPGAKTIYLEGVLHYQLPDGTWQDAPWKDSLQLSIDQPITEPNPRQLNENSELLSAYSFQLSNPESYSQRGLLARYSIPVPERYSYAGMDMDQSKLLWLQDDQQQDLLQISPELEEEIRIRHKQQLDPDFSTFTNLRQNNWNFHYGSINPKVEFNVYSQVMPSPGTQQIRGKAKIVYNYAHQDSLQIGETSVDYAQQEKITLDIDGHLIPYTRSVFTEEIDGVNYTRYMLDQESLSVLVIQMVVLSGEEFINPDAEKHQFPMYDLFIPETVEDEQLTIGLQYAELRQHEELIDLEVSINGTVGN